MSLLVSLLLIASLGDDARFHDATARFKRLDYEGCLADLDKLLAEPRPDSERTTLLLYSGAARALLGDDGAAKLAFESALRIDPNAALEFKTSPKVTALFDDVKRAVVVPPPSPPPPPPLPTDAPIETHAEPARDEAQHHADAKPSAVAANASSSDLPTTSQIVGVAASIATIATVAGGSAFAVDVASKMSIANDKATSQLRAQELVDGANASLVWSSVLIGAGVATTAVAVAAFAWP